MKTDDFYPCDCHDCFWEPICAAACDAGWAECHIYPPFIPIKKEES